MKTCHKCGHDQFKKVSLIFQEGRSTTRGAAISSSGGVSVGGGIITTDLAKRCGPPRSDNAHIGLRHRGLLVASLGVVWIFGMLIGFGALENKWNTSFFWTTWALCGFSYIVYDLWKAQAIEALRHKQALAEYDKQYMCLRCGEFITQIVKS